MAKTDSVMRILSEKGMRIGEAQVWKNMEYFWADQIYSETGVVFAKYLLLPLSLDQWKDFLSSDEPFSTEVIEETYYRLRNDLCWNLYLVCILSDEDFEQIDQHTRFELERNTNYIRKIVLKESELDKRLPVGHTLFRTNDEPLVQPEQEWREILKGEYEFCLDAFQSEKFDAIASDMSPQQKNVFDTPSASTEKISSIHSIHIPQGFRPHFYSSDINLSFPKANLFSGANGAGKTSVFSAIELAMTGTVRKQHPVLNDPADQAEVSLTLCTDRKKVEIHKISTAREKKQREAKWYKNRAENRTPDQLNVLFHRFNYFSVDDTYLFTSEQPDHDDVFSKLLYGPETTTKWKNIKTWRENCERKSLKLSEGMEQLDGLLRKKSSVETIDESGLRSYIKRSGLLLAPNASYSQIAEILGEIQAELNRAEACKPILSRAMLTVKSRDTEQQLAHCRGKAVALQGKFKKYNKDYRKLELDIGMAQGRLRIIRQKKENLSPLEEWMPALAIETTYYKVFQDFRESQQELEKLEKKINRLRCFWNKYYKLLTCAELPDLAAQWEELREKEADLRTRTSEVEARINEAEIHAELGKKLLDQLQSIGKQIVQEIPFLHQCPLCGTKNIEANTILLHLEREQDISSKELNQLYHEKKKLEGVELQLARQRKTLRQLGETADTITTAFQDAKYLFPKLAVGEPLETIKRALEEIELQNSHRDQLQQSLAREKKFIKTRYIPKQSKILLEDVLSVENRVRELFLKNNYSECRTLSGEMLQQRVLDIFQKLEREENELENMISDKKAEQDAIPFQELTEQQNACYNRLAALEDDMAKWKQMALFWENVSEWVFSKAVDLDGPALQAHCEKILNDVKNITEYAANQQEREKLIFQKAQLKKEYNNYQKVVNRLKDLRALETYSQEFIRQNIEQISRIFLSLHLPQEFSGLAMVDKELVGVRGGEHVPIVNMSTGQRTALVLSFFFQLHLSNSAAPEFLLIDEPVANIDELNVLSLMDFLRELVISHGRQVFFTTASRNVAQLFRRKFSFLKEDFQRLDFIRKSTEDLEISQVTYNQEKAMKRKSVS